MAEHDFVAESKGRCFLCSEKSSSSSPSPATRSGSSYTYSLHCLARYLKIDMRKVFTGSGPIPSHLVDRVTKSRLTAELCEECAKLTKKFSKLYRHLEKVEMEMGSCLNVIHGKLGRATKLDNLYNAENWNNDAPKDEWRGKLEITEALRKDTLQTCSRKIAGILVPLAKLERLTQRQIDTMAKELTVESRKTDGITEPTSSQCFESNYEDVGSPGSVSAPNENGSGHLDKFHHPVHLPMEEDNYIVGLANVKQEVMEGTSYSNEVHDQSKKKVEAVSEPHHEPRSTVNELGQLSGGIPPPIKISNPDARKLSKTSQYKCQICKRNFSTPTGYRRHYLGIHIGVKYKCSECDKTFSDRSHLIYHQSSVHLGKAFECHYCSKTFSMPHTRNRHMKTACSKQKGDSAVNMG